MIPGNNVKRKMGVNPLFEKAQKRPFSLFLCQTAILEQIFSCIVLLSFISVSRFARRIFVNFANFLQLIADATS